MSTRTATVQERPISYWLKKNKYYHSLMAGFYRFVVPQAARVLDVGGEYNYLKNYPNYTFVRELSEIQGQEHTTRVSFDYILLPHTLMTVEDIQTTLEQLKPFCAAHTRLVIDTYSYLWEPVLILAQKLGLRRPTYTPHWLSQKDLTELLSLANYEVVTSGGQILLPVYVPIISWVLNCLLAPLPGIAKLCMNKWIIARPKPQVLDPQTVTVSVVIPCRNERGNIAAAVARTPNMGKHTELIFVEGHSKDDTFAEIERVAQANPQRDISYFVQQGKGKGAAVRQAFAQAKGDVLMILDADLTVPPEEMPKFFDALIRGKGELINGSRLIYGMESGAMRFLNLLANFGFARIFTWLLNQRIKDTLCGTKVLFKRDYEKIVANRSFFGDFDPYGDFDLLFGAAKQNLKIIDMPVHYQARTYGTSQISRFQGGFLLSRMCITAFMKLKIR